LGGGSNLLISDQGVNGLVIANRARQVRFDEQADPPAVWAESGANFGLLARQAAQRGLSGLEWAAGIPGALGGAVYGNAGAHGADMAANLSVAEILHRGEGPAEVVRESWPAARLNYAYRSSALKRSPGRAVVLSAVLHLQPSTPEAVQVKTEEFVAYRKRTQPPGASLGSMFKNPPGDYAGRLIEAAGLKGTRLGEAQISPVHANFFINLGQASAADLRGLLLLAQERVAQQFGVMLDPEIELAGEWTSYGE
jgi:UDP-N-acetylmuramate dehydrogenase